MLKVAERNQSLLLVFQSTSELSEFLRRIGFKVDVTQITNGKLLGSIKFASSCNLSFLSIDTNQGLQFHGEYNPKLTTLAMETCANRECSMIQGENLPQKCIAGYGTNKSSVFYSVSPGSSMSFIFAPSILFQGMAHQISGDRILNIIHNSNVLRVNDADLQYLASQCKLQLDQEKNLQQRADIAHDYMMKIHDIMLSNTSKSINSNPAKKSLVLEFVKLALSNQLEHPVTIHDLSKNLFTSKTNLSSQIKKAMGLSPMAFIKCVRLEQVRRELLQSNGHAVIGEVASQHGFTSRGHFARDYQNLFGERPTETLSRL